jgi:hypothetical protein
MRPNGEFKIPTDAEISQAVELLKEDCRNQLQAAIERQTRMYAAGAPSDEIMKVAALILSLEDTISRFSN